MDFFTGQAWDEPRIPEIVRHQQFMSNPIKKTLIMGFPIWGVLGTLRLGILLADGIDKQALATLNNLLLNHSGARLTEMNHG